MNDKKSFLEQQTTSTQTTFTDEESKNITFGSIENNDAKIPRYTSKEAKDMTFHDIDKLLDNSTNGTIEVIQNSDGKMSTKFTANVKEKNSNINYGKADKERYTVDQLVQSIYGDKATREQKMDLARAVRGDSVFYSEATEYGNYRFNMNKSTLESIGTYLSNHVEELPENFAKKTGNEYDFINQTEMFKDLDDVEKNIITSKMIEVSGGIEKKKAFTDYLVNDAEKKYGFKREGETGLGVRDDIRSGTFQSAVEKIRSNKKELLTNEELAAYNKVKGVYNNVKSDLEDISKQQDIDYEKHGVFGVPEIVKEDGKFKGLKYDKNSAVTRYAYTNSEMYKDLSGIKDVMEDYNVNEKGIISKVDNSKTIMQELDDRSDYTTLKDNFNDVELTGDLAKEYDKRVENISEESLREELKQNSLKEKSIEITNEDSPYYEGFYKNKENKKHIDSAYKRHLDNGGESANINEFLENKYLKKHRTEFNKYKKENPIYVDVPETVAPFEDRVQNRYEKEKELVKAETVLDDEYIKGNDIFHGNKDAENLYNVYKNGVNLNTEEREILAGYAYAKDLDDDDDIVANLNKASAKAFDKYGIDSKNIKYMMSEDNGLSIKYNNDGEGGTYIDEKSLDEDVLNSEWYKREYKGQDVSKKDLTKLYSENNRLARQRELRGDESTYENYLTNVENEIKGMSSPQIKDSGLGLSRREQLVKMGVEDKYAKEIDEAIGSDNKGSLKNISLEAMEAYKNRSTKHIEDYEVELGKLTNDQINQFISTNEKDIEEFMSGKNYKKLDEMGYEDKKKLISDMFDISDKTSRVGGAMKLHMTGKELKSADDVKNFYNELTDGGKINLGKLQGIFEVENRNGTGTLGKLLGMAFGKKSISELKKDEERGNVLDTVAKALDDAVGKYGDGLSEEDKDKIKKVTSKFKDRKFTEEELGALDGIIDKAKEYKEKYEKIEGKGFSDTVKKIGGNKTLRTVGGVAAAIGGIGLVANAVSKASEERERKRQEMNQLIAMQSSSLRGGY